MPPKRKTVYSYKPTGFDIWDPKTDLEEGDLVVKIQPRGCPPNGTMGHCFVGDPETEEFIGLVKESSLEVLRVKRS
jgi:hypothetical protein